MRWPRACSSGTRPASQPTDVRTLSQHWAGEARRPPTFAVVPLWITLVVGAALVLAAVMWMSSRLNRQATGLLQQLHDVHTSIGRRARRRQSPPSRVWRRCWPTTSTPALLGGQRRGAAIGRHAGRRHACSFPARRSCRRSNAIACGASRRRWPACPGAWRWSATPTTSRWSRCAFRRTGTCRASARRPSQQRSSKPGCRRRACAPRVAPRPSRARPTMAPTARARNRRVEVQLLLPRPEG